MARPRFSSPLKAVPKRVRSKRMTLSGTTSDAEEDLHDLPSPSKPNEHGTFHTIDSNPLERVTSQSLQEMPRRELMALCKRLGLKAVGKNVALIARIEALLPPPPRTRSPSPSVHESQESSREEWENSVIDHEQDQAPGHREYQQPQAEAQSNFDSSFNPFQNRSQHYDDESQSEGQGSSNLGRSITSSGTEGQDASRDELSDEQEPHPQPEPELDQSDEGMASASDGESEMDSDADLDEQQEPIERRVEVQEQESDQEAQESDESVHEVQQPPTTHSYDLTQEEQEEQEDAQASSPQREREPASVVADKTSQSFSQDLRQMFATPAAPKVQPTRSSCPSILSPLRNVFSPFRINGAGSQQITPKTSHRKSSTCMSQGSPASRSVQTEATPHASGSLTPMKEGAGNNSRIAHANSPQKANAPKTTTRRESVISSTFGAPATPQARPTTTVGTPQAFDAYSLQPQVEGTPKATTRCESVSLSAPKASATPQPWNTAAATPKPVNPQDSSRTLVPASCPPKKPSSFTANPPVPRSRKSMPGAWSFGPLASQPKPETKQPDEPMTATPTKSSVPSVPTVAEASPAASAPVAPAQHSTPGPSAEQGTSASARKSNVPTATRASFSNVAAKVLAEMHARLARASPSKGATFTSEASAQDQVPNCSSPQHKVTGAPLAKAGWTAPPPKEGSVSAKFAAAHEAQFGKMASIADGVRRPTGGASLKRMRSASGNSNVANASGEGTSTDTRPTKRARPTEHVRPVRPVAKPRPTATSAATNRAAARAGGAGVPPVGSRVLSTTRPSTIAGINSNTGPVPRTATNRPTRTELLRAQAIANRAPSTSTARVSAPNTKPDPVRRQTVAPRPPGPSAAKPSLNLASAVRKPTAPRASSSTIATRSPLKADKGLSVRDARMRALRAPPPSTAQRTAPVVRPVPSSQNGNGSSNALVPPDARIIKPIPKRRATTVTAASTPQCNDAQHTKQVFTLNRPRFTLAAVPEKTNSVPPSQPKPSAKPTVSAAKAPRPTAAQPKSATSRLTNARPRSSTSRGQSAATRTADEAKVAARREAMASRARARWAAKQAQN